MRTVHPLVAELDAARVELGLPEEIIAEVTLVEPEEVAWWGVGLRTPSLKHLVWYGAILSRRIAFADVAGHIVHVDELPDIDDVDDPARRLMGVLEERRGLLDISRSKVAADIGVSAAAAARWAAGTKPPSLVSFVHYSAALGWAVVWAGSDLQPVEYGDQEPDPEPAAAPPKREAGLPVRVSRPRRLHPLVAEAELLRLAAGTSGAALAGELGVHSNTVSRWSMGVKTPGVENLVGMVRALGRDIYIGPPTEGPPLPPRMVRRRSILQEIDLARGNSDMRWHGALPSYEDGTGPRWAQEAQETFVAVVAADRANQLTWATKVRAVVAEALAQEDPAELRAALLVAASTLTAWLEDLGSRTVAQPADPAAEEEPEEGPVL